MTNDTTRYDGAAWSERLTTHVNLAAEPIHALPIELQSRALAMLAASFDRELKPIPAGRWKGQPYTRGFGRHREGH